MPSEPNTADQETVSIGSPEPKRRRTIRVRQFQRAPVSGWYSVERLFDYVRAYLPDDIQVDLSINRHPSKGMLPRLMDALAARRLGKGINHILGDVHYLAWFLPRRRTLITVLDCIPLERTRGLRRFALWLLWYWWPLRRASHVAVISEFTRQSLLGWVNFDEERVVVIPPAVSRSFVYTPPRPHNQWSRILQIGTTPNKNVSRLIEALAGLDVTLVMVGHLTDPVRQLLKATATRFENHTNVADEALVDLYQGADVLVFPSTYEGWGMPIIEAQATGRPVVTSDIASMPEAAGGAACLIDPFDVASIRAGIVRILSNEQYAYGLIEAGRTNARQYDVKEIASRYAALYRQMST